VREEDAMESRRGSLIQPLGKAEHQFLQVLLRRFTLTREPGGGVRLDVKFGDDTDSIWQRQARDHLKEAIPDFAGKAKRIQGELDAFFSGEGPDTYEHNDKSFPFRYASGGALPTVRVSDPAGLAPPTEYYCLLYREIFPIGWNIANGGCDSREELLDPLRAMERELREELVAFDLGNEVRYVFPVDAGRPFDLDLPEFEVARRLLLEKFARQDFERFREMCIQTKRIAGPDSVDITVCGERPSHVVVHGCFLNINAYDFGIEVDCVVEIDKNPQTILCDGEMYHGELIDAPVGLFPVASLNQDLNRQELCYEFIPEWVYYQGVPRRGDEMKLIVREYLEAETRKGVRTEDEVRRYWGSDRPFDLCPVTRTIIGRYLRHQPVPKPRDNTLGGDGHDIFICYGGPDQRLAAEVGAALKAAQRRVFVGSNQTGSGETFTEQVAKALDEAASLVAVASAPDHLSRRWPRHEYQDFHSRIASNRKPDGRIIPFVIRFDPYDLPFPLRTWPAVQCQGDVGAGIGELLRLLS
jgi:hypothetical protein